MLHTYVLFPRILFTMVFQRSGEGMEPLRDQIEAVEGESKSIQHCIEMGTT